MKITNSSLLAFRKTFGTEARRHRTRGSRSICRRQPEAARAEPLPPPLPNLDSPFSYPGIDVRVTVVAGAQDLPFYPYFTSEQDHRHALQASRFGGERLLKSLRDGRYNARPEYGEALEYYLDDLPKRRGPATFCSPTIRSASCTRCSWPTPPCCLRASPAG